MHNCARCGKQVSSIEEVHNGCECGSKIFVFKREEGQAAVEESRKEEAPGSGKGAPEGEGGGKEAPEGEAGKAAPSQQSGKAPESYFARTTFTAEDVENVKIVSEGVFLLDVNAISKSPLVLKDEDGIYYVRLPFEQAEWKGINGNGAKKSEGEQKL